MFAVMFKNGLSFTIKATDRRDACNTLLKMMQRRSLPSYVDVVPA